MTRLGRYALHGEIASGGMASVHLGRLVNEAGFSRVVAIKRPHKHLSDDPDFAAMFLDEARLAARVRHANVVSTIDVGASEEGMFLVMDYVEGESLAALQREASRHGEAIPPSFSARIVADVLYGLHAAHTARDESGRPLAIVHRDVSPQNIMIGTDGLARVLDFGIAKATVRMHTTRGGQLKGKIRYMATEQVQNAAVSPRTDIYAASVVLWELLTGERLFDGDNDAGILSQVLAANVVPPSRIVPALPAAVDAIVLRGLARAPEDRFDSALEMAEALETALPPATARQLGQWVERLAGVTLAERAAQMAPIATGEPTMASRDPWVTPPKQAAPDIAVVEPRPGPAATTTQTSPWVPPGSTAHMEPLTPLASALEVEHRPRRARAVLATLATAMAAFVGVVAFRAVHTETKAPAAVAAAPAASLSGAVANVLPVQADEPPAATESSKPAPPAPKPQQRAHARGAHAAPAKPNCNPPYVVDDSGIRRAKPECL